MRSPIQRQHIHNPISLIFNTLYIKSISKANIPNRFDSIRYYTQLTGFVLFSGRFPNLGRCGFLTAPYASVNLAVLQPRSVRFLTAPIERNQVNLV